MKRLKAIWVETVFWLEVLLELLIVGILSIRFLIPFPKEIRGHQYEDWKKFLMTAASMFIIYQASKRHKPDN